MDCYKYRNEYEPRGMSQKDFLASSKSNALFDESHKMQFSRYLKRHLNGEFNDLLDQLLSLWNQLDNNYKNYLVCMGVL